MTRAIWLYASAVDWDVLLVDQTTSDWLGAELPRSWLPTVTRIAIARDSDSRSAQHKNTQKGVSCTHIGYDFAVLEEKEDKSAYSPRGY